MISAIRDRADLREGRCGLQATIDLPADLVMRDSQVIDRVIEAFFEHRGLDALEVCIRLEPAWAAECGA